MNCDVGGLVEVDHFREHHDTRNLPTTCWLRAPEHLPTTIVASSEVIQAPTLFPKLPKVVQNLPRKSPSLPHKWSNGCSASANLGRNLPRFVYIGQMVRNFGQLLPSFCNSRANLGNTWANLPKAGLNLASLSQVWSTLVKVGPSLAHCSQILAIADQSRSMCQCWPNLA